MIVLSPWNVYYLLVELRDGKLLWKCYWDPKRIFAKSWSKGYRPHTISFAIAYRFVDQPVDERIRDLVWDGIRGSDNASWRSLFPWTLPTTGLNPLLDLTFDNNT